MPRQNVNDLLVFLAVAQERSFTRAAAKLGVPEAFDMVMVAGHSLLGKLGRSAEADAEGGRQGTRPQPPLLPATVKQGLRLDAVVRLTADGRLVREH